MKKPWRPGRPKTRVSKPEKVVENEQKKVDYLAYLTTLAKDVADGKRTEVVGSRDFWIAVEAQEKDVGERAAMQWVRRFSLYDDVSREIRLTLLRDLVDRAVAVGDTSLAIATCELLLDEGDLARQGTLAQLYESAGMWREASSLYEQILAQDINHPNARVRLAHLRSKLGDKSAHAYVGATMASIDVRAAGDRYQLIRELGRGGAGIVYEAMDLEIGRGVAIKMLHPHITKNGMQVERFFAEARTTASLRHPNIVSIFDIVPSSYALIMELAAGGTLKERLGQGRLTLREAMDRYCQLLSALSAAHRKGIAHLDIKPSNLLYRRGHEQLGSEIMIGDFGIASLMSEESTEANAGTLAYMAPEQRAGNGSMASDVYAAGLVLAEMLDPTLTERGFESVSLERVLESVEHVARECQDNLSRLLREVLTVNPDERCSSKVALTRAQTLRDDAMRFSPKLA